MYGQRLNKLQIEKLSQKLPAADGDKETLEYMETTAIQAPPLVEPLQHHQ